MNSQIVVGVGNIYASEALFRARISPRRAARRITREEAQALVQAIKDVLSRGHQDRRHDLAGLRQRRRYARDISPAAIRVRAGEAALPRVQVADQAVHAGPAVDLLVRRLPARALLALQYTSPSPSPRGSEAAATLPLAKSQVMTSMLPQRRLPSSSCGPWPSGA